LQVKDREAGDMIQIKNRYTGNVIKEVDAISLANANLRGVDLRGADLRGEDLNFAKLQNANLQRANLRDADLLGANLRGAKLQRANLRCAHLSFVGLQNANLQNANLLGANLQAADLQGAYLQDTDIRWIFGDGKRIKTLIDQYRIVIMQEYGVMAIGCEQHNIDEWMNFSDEEIDKMDTDALQWWKVWKPRIQQLIVG
jgi:hypothetical protein